MTGAPARSARSRSARKRSGRSRPAAGTRARSPDDGRDLLASAVDEVARLLQADGAIVYLVDPETRRLRFAFDAGIGDQEARRLIRDLSLPIGVGVFGHAVARGEVVQTGDYGDDDRFEHSEVADEIVRLTGIRTMAAAPLMADGEPLGALGAWSSRPGGFDDAQVALLRALADHAAAAIGNQRLIDRLALSKAELAKRMEALRTLGEMATQLTSLRSPSVVLEHALRAAVRLLGGDGGQIGTVSPDEEGRLRWNEGHSLVHGALTPFTKEDRTPVEHGVSGRAVRDGSPTWTGDYVPDPSFSHDPPSDRIARELGIRALVAAPLRGESGVIGAIAVYAERANAFDGDDADLMGLLADQVAIVLTNARLNAEAESSAAQLARRVDADRTLAAIAASIATIHETDEVLHSVVEAARRLIGSDGAHLTLMQPDGQTLRPTVVVGGNEAWSDRWLRLRQLEFPVNGGINGIAAGTGEVIATEDYLVDPRIPHEREDQLVAERLGLRGMASAPLRGPEGEVIGTLAVSFEAPHRFDDDALELLQGLADQGAIAITNARLYADLGESERRYRHLVDHSPDLVWSLDSEGRFTFLSDSLEQRTGWKRSDLLGRPFTQLVEGGSIGEAEAVWDELRADPSRERTLRLELKRADGTLVPVEVAMAGTLFDGRFAGAQGSVRDITERERLEDDLRRHAAELAATNERSHLARELHDSVTQALFSLGLTLRSLELLLDTDPEAARVKIRELRELQRDALAEMRTLIFELRPASLETDGLVQALRNHATAVQRRTGLTIVVEAQEIPRLALPVEEALYRIGQEAIHNVVKHANPSRAAVRLWRDAESVHLAVEDDGVGFSPDAVPRGHLGLLGMRQRLDLIGGELRIDSGADRGTTVQATVPLGAEDAGVGDESAE